MAPKLSYSEIHAALCASGQFFEVETRDIRGVPTRTWKNAPATLREVVEQGARNAGSRDFIVLSDERMSHERHLELVNSLAATLVDELGVRKGDRVAIAMRPSRVVGGFFAATMVGAIAVPFNAFWNGEEPPSPCRLRAEDLVRRRRAPETLARSPAPARCRARRDAPDDRKGTADFRPGFVTSTGP